MKEPWFISPSLGRFFPVHWKGWACLGALAMTLMAGAVLDDVLRSHGNAVLYYVVMCPIGVVALVLAGVIADTTERT
ncbi:hypothetical protein SAMN05216304_10560 [Bosea sp. OK403]|uniref:hypothetical protein n=1 Tax=Bosea sp. OK403 TaxID=1855286 RepID=UPI0008F3E6B5|nr:hypothetical protein [Bosea sp. OK403]SFJ14644.1 hypothetical protein SAMN05216304_10560 [Bosea sp. OK403]